LRLRGTKQEAIHAGILDCFTLRVRNDVAAGRLHELSFSLSALLKYRVFFPQDIPVNRTVTGHPEFSAGNVDVFFIELKISAGSSIEKMVHCGRKTVSHLMAMHKNAPRTVSKKDLFHTIKPHYAAFNNQTASLN
jgi:hypothetical protein